MSHTETTSTDAIFDALSNSRRRQLLFALLEHNPQVVSPQSTNGEKQYTLKDYHVHLPKLTDNEFITYESNKMEKGPRFEEIRPVLELLESQSDELPGDLV